MGNIVEEQSPQIPIQTTQLDGTLYREHRIGIRVKHRVGMRSAMR